MPQIEYIYHTTLVVPEKRQRRIIDEMMVVDLADSIEKNDLIHPLAVRDDGQTLIAGECRLRAMQQLHRQGREFYFNGALVGHDTIPVVAMSPRSEVDYLEAELAENMERNNLTWQDESLARARIHEIRSGQRQGQTISDTAAEIAVAEGKAFSPANITSLSEDVQIADYLLDEDIGKAKTKREALKILGHKKQKEKNTALAEKFKREAVAETLHTLLHGDAIASMKELEPESFDVILTDPPYGVGAHTFGDQTLINHEYDDSEDHWFDLMLQFSMLAYQLSKPEAHAYVFCDIRRFTDLSTMMKSAGWDVWDRPLIWSKGNQGTLPRPEHGPRLTYETILYAIKGNRRTQKVGHDVLSHSSTVKPRHAAEKPVSLYGDLLSRSVRPGDHVLDPFCGTGTIFPAANLNSVRATGIELEIQNIGIAQGRLEEKGEE